MDGRPGGAEDAGLLIQDDLDHSVTYLAAMAATAYRTPKIRCPQITYAIGSVLLKPNAKGSQFPGELGLKILGFDEI